MTAPAASTETLTPASNGNFFCAKSAAAASSREEYCTPRTRCCVVRTVSAAACAERLPGVLMARSRAKENADVFNVIVVYCGAYERYAVNGQRQLRKCMRGGTDGMYRVEHGGGAVEVFEVGLRRVVHEERVGCSLSRGIGEHEQERVARAALL